MDERPPDNRYKRFGCALERHRNALKSRVAFVAERTTRVHRAGKGTTNCTEELGINVALAKARPQNREQSGENPLPGLSVRQMELLLNTDTSVPASSTIETATPLSSAILSITE